MSLVRSVDVAELSVLLKGEQPVLIDFWAPWCAPCLRLLPLVEEVAAAYTQQLTVVKVDIADYPDLAGAMEVVSVPNLQFFNQGKCVGKKVGFMLKADLEAWVKECLEAI